MMGRKIRERKKWAILRCENKERNKIKIKENKEW